jgi:hypothetical protein
MICLNIFLYLYKNWNDTKWRQSHQRRADRRNFMVTINELPVSGGQILRDKISVDK